MKVLFFCNLAPRKTGSFEALLGELAKQFKDAGDELVYVFADEPIEQVRCAMRDVGCGIRVIQEWVDGEGVSPWRFVGPALTRLREERPDVAVVHFGNELPSLVTAVLGKLLGLRTRWVWQQDQQIQDPGRLSSRISRLRALAPVFTHFVAMYEGGRRSMALRGIPQNRITVVNNSAPDYQRQRDPGWLRRECGIPGDACLCVTVSSLIPRKRVDAVLRAFAELVNSYSVTVNGEEGMACQAEGMVGRPPHLLLVGDGPERRELESLCGALGLSDRVHFLGLRNDVREILLEADLLVHAATAEACSYAIIESMASGIPAVVTDSGAAREQIVDGETGFVVDRDDLDGFATQLDALIRDAARRKQMGSRARQRWRERYRVEVAAAEYHDLYRSLAEGRES